MRNTGACDVKESFDVGVEHLVPICVCDVDCGLICAVYSGTVEDVINSSMFRYGGRDELVALLC